MNEVNELFAIKDTKSGQYLNNIWLTTNEEDISLFMTVEEAQHHIVRIRMGKFVSKGVTGFYAEDLVVVRTTNK